MKRCRVFLYNALVQRREILEKGVAKTLPARHGLLVHAKDISQLLCGNC
jgi:hypothetical protein